MYSSQINSQGFKWIALGGLLSVLALLTWKFLEQPFPDKKQDSPLHFEEADIYRSAGDAHLPPRELDIALSNLSKKDLNDLTIKASCGCAHVGQVPSHLSANSTIAIPVILSHEGFARFTLVATAVDSKTGSRVIDGATVSAWASPSNRAIISPTMLDFGLLRQGITPPQFIEIIGEDTIISGITVKSQGDHLEVTPAGSERVVIENKSITKHFYRISIAGKNDPADFQPQVVISANDGAFVQKIPVLWRTLAHFEGFSPTSISLGALKSGETTLFYVSLDDPSRIRFEYDKSLIHMISETFDSPLKATACFSFTANRSSGGPIITNIAVKDSGNDLRGYIQVGTAIL